MEPSMLTGLCPAMECFLQQDQDLLFLRILGKEPVGKEIPCAFNPVFRGGKCLSLFPPLLQALEYLIKLADQCSFEATDFGVGLDPLIFPRRSTGVSEQHPLQPKKPGILLPTASQAQALALRPVEAPTYPGSHNPSAKLGQLLRVQTKTIGNRRHVQQIQNLRDPDPMLVDLEQPFTGNKHRDMISFLLIDNREGKVARIISPILSKGCANGGSKVRDIGNHDDNVSGA